VTAPDSSNPPPSISIDWDDDLFAVIRGSTNPARAQAKLIRAWVRLNTTELVVREGADLQPYADAVTAIIQKAATVAEYDRRANVGSAIQSWLEQTWPAVEHACRLPHRPEPPATNRNDALAALALLVTVLQLLVQVAGPRPLSQDEATQLVDHAIERIERHAADPATTAATPIDLSDFPPLTQKPAHD
jgi:hypothetical protein